AHFGGGFGHFDSGLVEGGLLGFGGAFAAGDDGPGVSHASSGRGGGPGDEGGDGFVAVFGGPGGGFFFGSAADLADHDDGLGLRIVVEHLEHVEVGGAVDGVAADADAGGLAEPGLGELPDGLVGESAGAGDDADIAALVDVA